MMSLFVDRRGRGVAAGASASARVMFSFGLAAFTGFTSPGGSFVDLGTETQAHVGSVRDQSLR
jgi:hypothetical protein